MDQFFKLFTSLDQLLIIAAAILILIGLVAPKRFLGIEVDWTPAKSAIVIVIGLALLVFSIIRMLHPDDGFGSADIYPDKQLPQQNPNSHDAGSYDDYSTPDAPKPAPKKSPQSN